jgi:predicted nuclease of predicted toxin-antitoxin system
MTFAAILFFIYHYMTFDFISHGEKQFFALLFIVAGGGLLILWLKAENYRSDYLKKEKEEHLKLLNELYKSSNKDWGSHDSHKKESGI